MIVEAGAVLSESIINTKIIFSFNFQKNAVKLYMEILESEKTSYAKDSVLFDIFSGLGIFFSFSNHACFILFSKKFFAGRDFEIY